MCLSAAHIPAARWLSPVRGPPRPRAELRRRSFLARRLRGGSSAPLSRCSPLFIDSDCVHPGFITPLPLSPFTSNMLVHSDLWRLCNYFDYLQAAGNCSDWFTALSLRGYALDLLQDSVWFQKVEKCEFWKMSSQYLFVMTWHPVIIVRTIALIKLLRSIMDTWDTGPTLLSA